MKDFCIILVFNNAFLNKAKDTIQQIRNVGMYNGDIVCVVGDDLIKNETEITSISDNIVYKHFPDINRNDAIEVLKRNTFDDGRTITKAFQFHKFYCFDTYFRENYKKCLYIDCGMRIFKPLDKIINLDCDGLLLAHSDAYPTYEWKLEIQFDKTKFWNLHSQLTGRYYTNCDYFQSTMMMYDTQIILDDTLTELIDLSRAYINSRNNDQGILALYFICIRNVWMQIKIKDDETYYYDFSERNGLNKNNYIMLKYPKT